MSGSNFARKYCWFFSVLFGILLYRSFFQRCKQINLTWKVVIFFSICIYIYSWNDANRRPNLVLSPCCRCDQGAKMGGCNPVHRCSHSSQKFLNFIWWNMWISQGFCGPKGPFVAPQIGISGNYQNYPLTSFKENCLNLVFWAKIQFAAKFCNCGDFSIWWGFFGCLPPPLSKFPNLYHLTL